ncbi:MAG: TlpA family protein disulfide reductase [Bryobacteraceae bacterium]|nr:TlpA family protein disulfide reductase [Bryobacteraceae bacterium]
MTRLILSAQLVLIATFGLLLRGTLRQVPVETGETAPAFALTMDSGATIGPRDFGGKLLVLNFWASWCPPCLREMPSLHRFAQAMRGEGVVVAAVSIDGNAEPYRRYLQKLRPAFLTARDAEARVSASFGTFAWPETYVIDGSGRVRRKYIAERDWMDPQILADIAGLARSVR